MSRNFLKSARDRHAGFAGAFGVSVAVHAGLLTLFWADDPPLRPLPATISIGLPHASRKLQKSSQHAERRPQNRNVTTPLPPGGISSHTGVGQQNTGAAAAHASVLNGDEVVVPYPPQAAFLGVEGEVELSLIVSADGTLARAEVIRGLGHGCDEAALLVAGQLRFSPAINALGQPTADVIGYRVRFQLAT